MRLARRLTFSLFAQRESKQRENAPGIRPQALRTWGSFAPSVLQGHVAKGHPWPIAPLAASMPLNPLHTDSAHPSDGTVSPCILESRVDNRSALSTKSRSVEKPQAAFSTLRKRFGSWTVLVRRPSAGVVQRGIWHGCQMSRDGPRMALRDDPRSSTGTRGVSRSETRMPGGVSFAYFSLRRAAIRKQRKVRRPRGRNQMSVTKKDAEFWHSVKASAKSTGLPIRSHRHGAAWLCVPTLKT